ncbi:MAG: cobalamin B12-binding domain-containing protein [Epulopiscium sp.]|nr:cobalamin B12-binding domain-containing protein [Candidatus Epulonipiscium sp.]
MRELYEKLLEYLKNEDKEKSLNLCIDALKNQRIGVIDLYQSVLAPALNHIVEEYIEEEDLIWKEHVRSGIIRTIVENTYPFVIKEKGERGRGREEKVIVMCPRFEDHELGARMISDLFTIAGYDTTFIGANTPEKTILKAVEVIQPTYISISVTNYYNLISAKTTIDYIKNRFGDKIIFLLGGQAFVANPDSYQQIGGDFLLNSFDDIVNLTRGGGSNLN